MLVTRTPGKSSCAKKHAIEIFQLYWRARNATYLLRRVPRKVVFVHVEYVIDHRVDPVENRVAHRRRRFAEHAEGLKVALVGVVHQGNGHVQKVVQVTVELAVEAVFGRLHHVTQHVDATLLGQSD